MLFFITWFSYLHAEMKCRCHLHNMSENGKLLLHVGCLLAWQQCCESLKMALEIPLTTQSSGSVETFLTYTRYWRGLNKSLNVDVILLCMDFGVWLYQENTAPTSGLAWISFIYLFFIFVHRCSQTVANWTKCEINTVRVNWQFHGTGRWTLWNWWCCVHSQQRSRANFYPNLCFQKDSRTTTIVKHRNYEHVHYSIMVKKYRGSLFISH